MPNPELQLAHDLIRGTDLSVFLTGKAGTGKTTFLHALKADAPKPMIVTAPTGVAAINAGGVTLHSFFQLPFGPCVPGGEAALEVAERRFSRQKRELIEGLDLLVIDEISMVRADLLDAVDGVLRRERRSHRPFGGVQLLMIGDLHQLPPVVPDQDWQILRDFYETGYFFGSRAFQASEVVPVVLTHIYRQSDADFIELLNRVRDNRLDDETLARLNARCRPGFRPAEDEGYITLTTHNRAADRINDERLSGLSAKAHHFKADIDGEFPPHGYPTADNLTLKQGAQVMFVRNDVVDKRYFNGRIGAVSHLERGVIRVRCPGDETEIEVEPATWESTEYRLDPETKTVSQSVIGTFTQYPLRLAWAITIHKSQGLTFERAIIDAGAAFSHGQVYVALSRCKTFEGMVLSAPIPRRAVMTDRQVADYVSEATRQAPTPERIGRARVDYQQRLLQECWDFDELGAGLRRLLGLLRDHRRVIDLHGSDDLDGLERHTAESVVAVGAKFRRELRSLWREDLAPEDDPHVQERLRKAAVWFSEQLGRGLRPWLAAFAFETDNQALRKSLRQATADLRETLAFKTACIDACRDGFRAAAYLGALARARIDAASAGTAPQPSLLPVPAPAVGTVQDPDLPGALRRWRDRKAEEEERAGLTRYRIFTRAVLREIAKTRPRDAAALAAVKGIGGRTVARYGREILEIVAEHRRGQGSDPGAAPRAEPAGQSGLVRE